MPATLRPPSRMTAEQMFADPTYRKGWELWDEIPVVSDASGGHAEICGSRLLVAIGKHLERHDLGWLTGSSQGFLVSRHPDRVLVSDVAFTSHRRLYVPPAKGFIECAPDFAAEVKSPTDSWNLVVTRLATWLYHGSLLAWGIDPEAR